MTTIPILERICYLIGHHHTLTGVDGPDYQVLLEADYLCNAGEKDHYLKALDKYRREVFKTKAGIALLEDIYS